jgi:hypothetical protein
MLRGSYSSGANCIDSTCAKSRSRDLLGILIEVDMDPEALRLQDGFGRYRLKATGFSVSKWANKKLGENPES